MPSREELEEEDRRVRQLRIAVNLALVHRQTDALIPNPSAIFLIL